MLYPSSPHLVVYTLERGGSTRLEQEGRRGKEKKKKKRRGLKVWKELNGRTYFLLPPSPFSYYLDSPPPSFPAFFTKEKKIHVCGSFLARSSVKKPGGGKGKRNYGKGLAFPPLLFSSSSLFAETTNPLSLSLLLPPALKPFSFCRKEEEEKKPKWKEGSCPSLVKTWSKTRKHLASKKKKKKKRVSKQAWKARKRCCFVLG